MTITSKNLGFIKAIHSDTIPPTNKKMLWYNENDDAHYYFDVITNAWRKLNVNADWNSTTGDTEILNKPTDLTDLSTHSATELNDITSVGSGKIISSIERNKLNTIEEGAEVNVKADWNSTTGDSQILNKPTDVTDLSLHNSSELNDGADLVKGQASSTIGYIAVAEDTSGKSIKYVPVTVDDSGNVVIPGNAIINGTLVTETLQVKDKNIEIAKVDTPTDDTADGGGITLLGATNKTITWVKSKLSWVFNQAVEIAGNLNVIGTIKTNGSQISTSDLSDGSTIMLKNGTDNLRITNTSPQVAFKQTDAKNYGRWVMDGLIMQWQWMNYATGAFICSPFNIATNAPSDALRVAETVLDSTLDMNIASGKKYMIGGTRISTSALSDGSDLVKNAGTSTDNAIPLFNGTTGKVIKSGFLGTDGNTNINQLNEIGQLDINPYKTLRLGRLTNAVDFSVRVMVGNNSVHDNHKLSGSTDSYLALLHGNVSIGKATATEKLDVEGNIKASGTVNGRDIAEDGEKLDSIINASGGTFTNIVRSIDGTTLNEEITLFTVPADRTALINRLYLFTSQSEDYTADGELRIYFTPKGSGSETSATVTNFGHPAYDTVFDLSTVLLEGSTVRLKVTTAITATTSNIICKADIIY